MPAEALALEQEGDAGRLLESLFESYASACRSGAEVDDGADAVFEEGMGRVREHLLSATGAEAACMVCLETIRPEEPVWACADGCHAAMHLPCIQSWARRALADAREKASQRLNPQLFPAAAAEAQRTAAWACPKCRQEYGSMPSGYTCWCGKAADPQWNPWNAAHSCGERCERPAAGCGHGCMLLCHPGPCPPCPRVVEASCHCGAVVAGKRCGRHEFSCGGVCGAELPCGHTCPAVCHDGECPPCDLASTVLCRCGAEAAQLPCSQQGVFQCGRVCGKPLDCGRHRCERVCHAGSCGSCALAGPKACPCGKQRLDHAACDAVVPPCGETCGKRLSCGVHTCNERCHPGPCPELCREVVMKSCECGRTQRKVQCQDQFRCDRRCANMRSCGRHPCRRRCCDGESCPPCEEVCNRWLKCPAPCHQGECAPCPLSARISCACGKTSYSVPCGREAAAKPPACSAPCPVPALCRHGAVPHRCHFGPCPPCQQACGMQLGCGHPCSSSRCHDPPPPAVPAYQAPPPPAAPVGPALTGGGGSSKQQRDAAAAAALPPAQAAAAEARQLQQEPGGQLSACPTCPVPVPVTCVGGHITVQAACSAAAPFACEQPCGRQLACGNHQCGAGCHDPATRPCSPCSLRCQRARGTCEHPCPLACHPPGTACPACELRVSQPCHCSKTTLEFACRELTAAALDPARLCCGKTCSRMLPGCPHTCQRACHAGACTSQGCSQETTVRCACKRLKQKLPCSEVQRLLAAATGSSTYDGATALRLLPCTATCAKAAAEPAAEPAVRAKRSSSDGQEASSGAGSSIRSLAAAAAEAAAADQQPRRKLSREEKARLAEEKAAAKEAAERRKALVRRAVLGAALALVLLVALGLRWLLLAADARAQAAWGRQEL